MVLVTGSVVAMPSVACAQARGAPIGFELWGSLGWAGSPASAGASFGGVGVRAGAGLRAAGFVAIGGEFAVDVGGRSGSLALRAGGGPIVTMEFGSLAGWSYFEPMLSIGTHFTTDRDRLWIDPLARLTLALAVNSFRVGLMGSVAAHVALDPMYQTVPWFDLGVTVQRYF